ncbi:MAG: hypothetical protein ABFD69_01570 [Candidatus Sumerlaeia bacterium]
MKINHLHGISRIDVVILSAMIGLIAMAAVPSFLESRTYSNVARARRDIRSLAVAMEAYRADNTSYPSWTPQNYDINNRGTIVNWVYTVPSYDAPFMSLLTTPVAYIGAVPTDVFKLPDAEFNTPPGTYRVYAIAYSSRSAYPGYYRNFKLYPRTGWMTWGVGPDRVSNSNYLTEPVLIANEALVAPNIGKDQNGYYIAGTAVAMGMRYDPTNGLLSYGDLYHFGGDCKDHVN